jgi:ribonuclease P protein component
MISLPGTGLIGIATSKKLGSAPARNRVKRRFREAIRTQPEIANSELDVVIIVSASSAGESFVRIQEEVRKMCEETKRRWASESESS